MNNLVENQTKLDQYPLVTFTLFAYNQETFIHEAIAGALAQTYTPLEIILSDDCSTDGTFEIMKNMATNYTGPHQIVLIKIESNLGVASHVNKIISLAKGSLIIASAGDDISFPNRTAELTELWINNGKPSGIIYSQYEPIDNEGNVLNIDCLCKDVRELSIEEFASRFNPGIVGATQAWTKDLFIKCGPLPKGVFCEDAVFAFRAKLYGEILFLDRVLLKYRIHPRSLSNDISLTTKEVLQKHKRATDIYRVFIDDVLKNSNESELSNLMLIIKAKIKHSDLIVKIVEGSFYEKLLSIFEIINDKNINRSLILKELLMALMPKLHTIYKYI